MSYIRNGSEDLAWNANTNQYESARSGEDEYIPADIVTISNATYQNNTNMISIDLQNTPFVNNNMSYAFQGCTNLVTITNINNNVTNLSYAFRNCSNLVNIPSISNNVTNLDYTFAYCNSLSNVLTIPDLITNLDHTFYNCTSLTTAPSIPNSVTNMEYAFANSGLTTAPSIPNSVTNLMWTFGGTNITTAPIIPESVTTMNSTFYDCQNLTGDVYIYSEVITNASSCFTEIGGIHNIKYVYIPFKDSNNNYTATYNSFISAGYDTNGTKDDVYLRELVKCTLTINPIPSDATVTFIGDGEVSIDGKSITVLPNTSVTYTVSSDYDTISNTIIVTNNLTITVDTLGLDWSDSITERNFSSADEIEDISIVYNGSKYISVLYTYNDRYDEDYSYISTSTDGIMWTSLVSIDYYKNYIAYGNNKFVILDNYGQIMVSDDGETWSSKTAVSNLGNNNWGHIVYGNNKFIALCYDTNGYISTSIDGTNWTLAEQNSTLSNYTWSDLIYDGSKFIALSTNGYISTSTDGTNWTTPIQDNNLNGYTWKSIAYDNSKYVMLSYNGFISVSTNCTNWTTPVRELPNLGNSNGWIHINYNGNNFVAFSEYMNYIIYTKSENTPDLTLTINPIPSDATVTFNSSGTVSGNSITVQYGNYVTYSVDKSGYKSIKSTLARPTSINTQIDVTLIDLDIWEFIGTPTNKTAISKDYRYDLKYSSYYNKYYTIVDDGYSTCSLLFTSDFLNYTIYKGHFGVLSSGQIVKITGTVNRDSSTGIYTKTIDSQLLNSDLTWTTSTTIYSETAEGTSYPSLYVHNGYMINGSLCFPVENQINTKKFNNYFMYTHNGTSWNRYVFNSNNDTYGLQLTSLGSDGNYATIVITTSSGRQLHKFPSPTSKTAGDVLFTGLNMTGASGFYDGHSFNYNSYRSTYRSNSSYFTTNGTTKSMYQGRTYEDYVSIQQRYISGNNVYINVKREDLTKLAVLSADYNTKHTELTTPIRIRNILGLIDNYIYVYDEDGDIYRTNYVLNILSLI